MKTRGGVALAGLFVLLGAAMSLAVRGRGESARTIPSPVPSPTVPQEDPARSYANETEDRVLDLENSLLGLARHIRRQAAEGALSFFTADFQGSPLLALPPPEATTRDLGQVAVTRWKEKSSLGDRSPIAPALRSFYRTVAQIPFAVFKIRKCDGDGRRMEGVMTLEVDGVEPGGGRVNVKEFYDAVWTREEKGPWRIARLTRTAGRRLRAERTLFADVTASLKMDLPVAVEREDLPVFMEPYSFLGGIAAGDYDGDGDLDLYVPRIGRNLLYRNDGGAFTEVGRESGTDDTGAGAGAIFFDFDNDGRLDLLVTNHEPSRVPSLEGGLRKNDGGRALVLYRNRGDGTFEDVTQKAGIGTQGPATSAAAADIDGDGDLDFYVCMYKDFSADETTRFIPIANDVFRATNGVANQLWINQGNGTFREEAAPRGVADTGWSFAAAFGDFDGDGDADLCVANDYGEKRLYRNDGGTFVDVSKTAGVADTGFGMGVAWGDADGDGRLDLYVANMYSTAGNRVLGRGPGTLEGPRHEKLLKMARGNTLLRGRGDGTFEDTTDRAGVGSAGWAWGTAFFDYDLDGRPDLYVANGYITGESELDL